MFVPNVSGFDGIGLRLDAKHHIHDVPQGNVSRMWAVPTAPADVIADTILWNVLKCTIQSLDAQHRVMLVFLNGWMWIKHVPSVREARIVELQDKAGIDNWPCIRHGEP